MTQSTLICFIKYFQDISEDTSFWHSLNRTRISSGSLSSKCAAASVSGLPLHQVTRSLWVLVPLWLCRINDAAACGELNQPEWYCYQNQATTAPSPKWLLSGKKIMSRTSVPGNTEDFISKLSVESLETLHNSPLCFICSSLALLVRQADAHSCSWKAQQMILIWGRAEVVHWCNEDKL